MGLGWGIGLGGNCTILERGRGSEGVNAIVSCFLGGFREGDVDVDVNVDGDGDGDGDVLGDVDVLEGQGAKQGGWSVKSRAVVRWLQLLLLLLRAFSARVSYSRPSLAQPSPARG